MEFHFTLLLLATGLAGSYSLTTVREVPVKAGESISIPCLYEPQYRRNKKYVCKGYDWLLCDIQATSNRPKEGWFIYDDASLDVFTVTILNVGRADLYLWCAVERKNHVAVRSYFQLSVAPGVPQLHVDHQMVKGFAGEDLTISCRYRNHGESQWCTLGGSCVGKVPGTIDGTSVAIDTFDRVFIVTMKGLRMESSGWYYCAKGLLQMPVHVAVRRRPTTTTKVAATTTTTPAPTTVPAETPSASASEAPATTPTGPRASMFQNFGVIIVGTLSALISIAVATFLARLVLKKCRKSPGSCLRCCPASLCRFQSLTPELTGSSSAAPTTGEEVEYSVVAHKREARGKLRERCATDDSRVVYSSLATFATKPEAQAGGNN